jgi:hypothetical protein
LQNKTKKTVVATIHQMRRGERAVGGGRGVSRFGILGRGPGRSRYRYLALR